MNISCLFAHLRLLSLLSLLSLPLALVVPLASAGDLPSPGRAEVLVADQTDRARQAATAEGINQVLSRLTGDPAIADTAIAAEFRDQADSYLQGFSYRRGEDDDLFLVARYDIRGLREALVAADIPIWPPRPPTVLAWVSVDDGEAPRMLQAGDNEDLGDQLAQAAADLGLQVLFPIMDLQDMGAISHADIAAGFVDPVINASGRYGADRLLAGQLVQRGGSTRVSWMLVDPDDATAQRWRVVAEQPERLVTDTLEPLLEPLRAQFAYLPDLDARGRLVVRVSGIADLAIHDRIVERLESLGGVARVTTVWMQADAADFQLSIGVEPEQIHDSLNRDPRLSATTDGYRWE